MDCVICSSASYTWITRRMQLVELELILGASEFIPDSQTSLFDFAINCLSFCDCIVCPSSNYVCKHFLTYMERQIAVVTHTFLYCYIYDTIFIILSSWFQCQVISCSNPFEWFPISRSSLVGIYTSVSIYVLFLFVFFSLQLFDHFQNSMF